MGHPWSRVTPLGISMSRPSPFAWYVPLTLIITNPDSTPNVQEVRDVLPSVSCFPRPSPSCNSGKLPHVRPKSQAISTVYHCLLLFRILRSPGDIRYTIPVVTLSSFISVSWSGLVENVDVLACCSHDNWPANEASQSHA